MQINKDDIRARINDITAIISVTELRGLVKVLLASDDAKDETIRQQAAEIERLKLHVKNATYLVEHANARLQQSEEARIAAERERDELRKSRGEWLRMSFELGKCNTALRECLAWYANEDNHVCDDYVETAAPVVVDGGEKARTLLAELDRKDTQLCNHAVQTQREDNWICDICGKPVEDTQGEGGR